MNYEWLGFIGTGLVIFAYMPQVTHLIIEQCSAGMSLCANITWAFAATLLLIYAISLNDLVFIILQLYQVAAMIVISYYCKKYKDHLCEEHGG